MVERYILSRRLSLLSNANKVITMRSIRLYLSILAFVLCGVVSSSAQVSQSFSLPAPENNVEALSNAELWDKANTAYANNNYMRAERLYSEILMRDVHSAELYYNLGNVHHKRGKLGLSLLYYYKALRLSPSDSDIRHNIEVANAKTTDNIEQMPRIFLVEWSEWVGSRLSCMEWSVLSLILLAISLGGLLLYLVTDSLKMRRLGFFVTLFVGLIFVLATRHAFVERAALMNPDEAIVMSESISVKSSPNSSAIELFLLHEGTKVKVVTTHDTWCEIVIDDGKKGWVESRRIEII